MKIRATWNGDGTITLNEAVCIAGYWVPRHFRCDGASIPRFAWSIIGHPFGAYLPQAILHDEQCRAGVIPRKRADEIFRDGLLGNSSVGKWRAYAMYYAVRLYSLWLIVSGR